MGKEEKFSDDDEDEGNDNKKDHHRQHQNYKDDVLRKKQPPKEQDDLSKPSSTKSQVNRDSNTKHSAAYWDEALDDTISNEGVDDAIMQKSDAVQLMAVDDIAGKSSRKPEVNQDTSMNVHTDHSVSTVVRRNHQHLSVGRATQERYGWANSSKVRINLEHQPDFQRPGAIRVYRPRSHNLDSSSVHSSTSFHSETEGSRSFRKKDKDKSSSRLEDPSWSKIDPNAVFETEGHLAPNEAYELVEAKPMSHKLSKAEHDPKSRNRKVTNIVAKSILIGLMLILLCIAIVIGIICRNGQCSGKQQANTTTSLYSPFMTSEDLMDAIDIWMSGNNRSQIEEEFGMIQDWDVSHITNFSHLFSSRRNPLARKFNDTISEWNVSSAITMEQMFYGAGLFEADISKWDMSKVTDMSYFMAEATFFDSDVSRWNMSSLINASNMFYWSSKFDGRGIENWDVSNVVDFSAMFMSCDSFAGDVSHWNVAKARDMSFMFSWTRKFDANLSQWDVSNVVNTLAMFQGAISFQGTGLDRWNTSQITSIAYMFNGASRFDNNLSTWDVSRVIGLDSMFLNAETFQGNGVDHWNTSNVETMRLTFKEAYSFNADLSRWDISKVNNTSWMFFRAAAFEGRGVELWNTSRIENMTTMFCGAQVFDRNLSLWNVSRVRDMSFMFAGAASFRGVGLEYWDTAKVQSMGAMFATFDIVYIFDDFNNIITPANLNITSSFDANLTKWDVSRVGDFSHMFHGASMFQGIGVQYWNTSMAWTMTAMFFQASLFDANLSNFDVSNLEQCSQMFQEASSFQGFGVDQWDTNRIFDMSGMFLNAESFDADLSLWDVSNVINMLGLFSGAVSFKGRGVDAWNTSQALLMSVMFRQANVFDANLSQWDTSKVIDMTSMFSLATSFQGIGLDTWDTSRTQSMTNMFYAATSFDGNLSDWDVSRVHDMSFMFQEASLFQGIGLKRWNISNVNNTAYMFESAISFNANLSLWDYANIQNMTDMFYNATSFDGVFWYDPKTQDAS